jgi:hypothetical protein
MLCDAIATPLQERPKKTIPLGNFPKTADGKVAQSSHGPKSFQLHCWSTNAFKNNGWNKLPNRCHQTGSMEVAGWLSRGDNNAYGLVWWWKHGTVYDLQFAKLLSLA